MKTQTVGCFHNMTCDMHFIIDELVENADCRILLPQKFIFVLTRLYFVLIACSCAVWMELFVYHVK